MRNLKNIKHTVIDFGAESSLLAATTWDPSDDSLICVFGPTENDPLLSLKRFSRDACTPDDCVAIASWDAPSPDPELPVDSVLSLHCFADAKIIVLVLAGGDIVVVREEPQPGEDLIEIVGSVDAGIAAAVWSPDEELLVIATRADTILFMTRDFESTANIALSPEDTKVSDHVSVGWGKAETQFKGRGAKALRDPTVPEHVDEGTVSEFDDGKVSLTWRGDGQYLAMNGVIDSGLKRRIIRIFSREGVLESVSQPVNGLGSALAWKPSGQLIATVQYVQDRADVVFFERNGLRHGEFSLRTEPEELQRIRGDIGLSWNLDSTVLAISFSGRVQLWTTGNYHWYLKQEIVTQNSSPDAGLVGTAWHPEKPLHLSCNTPSQFRALEYTFDVARGPVAPPYDTGAVAVIDGKKLKITPLRTANVPPPMAFDEIDLPDHAIDVAFSKTGTEIAVLHQSAVSIWQCDYSTKPATRAKLLRNSAIAFGDDLTPRQVAVLPQGPVLMSSAMRNEGPTHSTFLRVGSDKAEFQGMNATTWLSIVTKSDQTRACVTTKEGWNFEIHIQDEAHNPLVHSLQHMETDLPTGCPKVEIWRGHDQDIVFGLTASGVLHIKSELTTTRVPGCTSFLLAPSHLIYTTSQHLLKFVHLHGGDLEIPPDEPEKDERCRNIERGAKLVTVMPSAYSLVLQMPRGNLETIYPRALVLAGIRTSINNRDYKKAFLICRTHRVDMNILHDYAPEQFIRDVELFVKQVRKTEYIDLVLSSLSELNVAETIYKETLLAAIDEPAVDGATAPPVDATKPSKVNKICEAFIAVLQKNRNRHLQSIVTAHVCKNPPDLEAGLKLVSELRKSGDEAQLEQAVEHICFLADVNQLYDTALGLYDLDVALLVAQQSQKDPREYLPYLQSLQDMESPRQRFSIDNDLKRYRKALGHLHVMDAFEELKIYAGKHELHSAAMELYRYDKLRLAELMALYAEFLTSRNRYKDAGIAYEFVQDYTKAYESFRSANMWRESLAAAALVPVSDSELTSLAQTLAEGLEEAKDFTAAATIHEDYLSDIKNAVALFCKSHQYAEATRRAIQRRQPNLLSEVIDPGLIEGSATMTELFSEMKTQVNNQVPRLRELRQKKAEDPMAFLDGTDGGDADIPDNLSLAPTDASTSAGTFMTRYTNRSTGTLATNATRKTSKNKRREERKRARGKKGTVYEEEYLVNSIARLIERLNVVGEDVTRLVEGLMRRAMRERAVAVDAAMLEVFEACKACMSEVFGGGVEEKPVLPAGESEVDSEYRPVGGQGVLWDALTKKKNEPPVLKAFERLSLLG